MVKVSKQPKITYEPEADVLRVEVGRGVVDYAQEMGNVVVHFSQRGVPLYLEILEATKFVRESAKTLSKAGIPAFAR